MSGNQFTTLEREDRKYHSEEVKEKVHHKDNKHVKPTRKAVEVFLRGSKLTSNSDWEE